MFPAVVFPAAPLSEWSVVVLAGGRGARLGNDDKAAVTIGGTSVLDHLLSSLPQDVPVVVAGPERRTSRPVMFRRESPIHGGPVAGIVSALEAVATPVTALLAVDMPWAGGLVRQLIAELAESDAAALVPVDASGFRQPLCAVVRTKALRDALAELGDPDGRSLRDLMSLIEVRERPLSDAEARWVDDIDTPEDLRRARSLRSPSRVAARPSGTDESTVDESTVNESTADESTADKSTVHEQGVKPMMTTWINAVRTELNLPADVDVDVILDVARVAAHNVERPAAPVTTFLLGQAVAGGLDLNDAAAKIQELAANWPAPEDSPREQTAGD
ncbi:MAG: hypothetical protein QOE58_2188 [Actinomycetota bacterium]|nr:hypothetical protein [Actinomycetota bacterium]